MQQQKHARFVHQCTDQETLRAACPLNSTAAHWLETCLEIITFLLFWCRWWLWQLYLQWAANVLTFPVVFLEEHAHILVQFGTHAALCNCSSRALAPQSASTCSVELLPPSQLLRDHTLRDPDEPTWERSNELWVGNCKHTFIFRLIRVFLEVNDGSFWTDPVLPV